VRPRRAQQGIALIIVLAAIFMIGAYFLYASLNLATVRVERDQTTNDALRKAKAALIAYAVSDANRPGELPCPDVNDDGQLALGEDFGGGGACTSLIGRLPWKTLDLPDLRDDNGERLWYALSSDFRAGGSVALNSDTAYRTGNTSLVVRSRAGVPASPNGVVVAVVFSAGAALQRSDGVSQTRGCTVGTNCDATLKCTTSPASLTPKCNPQNYLDKESVSSEDNADLLPAANPRFVSADRSETFNDKLMPIYSDDIMFLVERRAGRELAQHLRDHYDTWANPPTVAGATFNSFKGFYPWAAPLNDPSAASAGANNTPYGQLPLSNSAVAWSNPTATLGSCSGNGTSQISCTAISLFSLLTVNARVQNVGTAFIDPPTAADVSVSGLVLGSNVSWTLNPAQQALDFQWSATIIGVATVTANVPQASSWTTSAPSSWVLTNNWTQNAFYAVAPGYAINGGNACGQCITVNNTASPSNKQAVVLMTGRALTGQTGRDSAVPPKGATLYLEGANATAAGPSIVLQSGMQDTAFNDYPIVVRP
jgi:hypothetical protein